MGKVTGSKGARNKYLRGKTLVPRKLNPYDGSKKRKLGYKSNNRFTNGIIIQRSLRNFASHKCVKIHSVTNWPESPSTKGKERIWDFALRGRGEKPMFRVCISCQASKLAEVRYDHNTSGRVGYNQKTGERKVRTSKRIKILRKRGGTRRGLS